MARETLGYEQLQWTCPNCKSENPGLQKTCTNCGGPQPENVTFHQPEQQTLITDEKILEQAKGGADIHCAFCGTRNPATAKVCLQCGADLKEGKQRTGGSVLGAFSTQPEKKVPCPHCGAENPSGNLKCAQCGAPLNPQAVPFSPSSTAKSSNNLIKILIGAGIALVLCVVIAFIVNLATRSTQITGVVQDVAWTRSIQIEQYGPVAKEDWRSSIPSNATIKQCEEKLNHMDSNPVPGAEKVCGTPYTVDQGNGAAEVVQDCEYKVMEDYCRYTVDEWSKVDVIYNQGNNFNPQWPSPQLKTDQRLGPQNEEYSISFKTDDNTYTYDTTDFNTYQQCQIGSEWILDVNGFGQLVSISLAQ